MTIKALFAFFNAPYFNSVLYKPLHNEWSFIVNPSNPVKHEYKQNIKFMLNRDFF